jgi:hypothetical protein
MACVKALPVAGAGLVLMTETGPAGMVAVTDGPAATMEELQFTLGEEPRVDASRTGRPVLQPYLSDSGPQRWPGFAAAALEAGILAIFAFPLQVGAVRGRCARPVSRSCRGAVGRRAGRALVLRRRRNDPSAADANRPDGRDFGSIPVIEDRAEVRQATGMVAVQAGVTLAQALALLRARAFAAERPIICAGSGGDLRRGALLGRW